ALVQDALLHLPDGPEFAFDRIYCLRMGAEVAQEQGQVGEQLARIQVAQRLLKQSPFSSDTVELSLATDLAKGYSAAGQKHEALTTFEEADRLVSALGRDDTETGAELLNDWALTLHDLGRVLEAKRIYERAIVIDRSGQADDAVLSVILNNYARVLHELGRLEEAASYAERAYAKAQKADDQRVINQSLIQRARIYRDQHDLPPDSAMAGEVEPKLEQSPPPGHYAFASVASEEALIALARNDLSLALQLANRSVDITEAAIKAGAEGSNFLPIFLVRRSMI